MADKQSNIKRLLESISSTLSLAVAPDNHMRDVEDELDFKSKQLQNSETTHNRLEAELVKREGELEKIESLDVKISLELQQVEAKMRQYEHDMAVKYDLVGELKERGQETLRKLEAQKQSLQCRQTALKRQVTQLRIGVDGKKRQLLDDETGSNLEAQEKKIGQYGQTLHTLRSYIDQKSSETDCRVEMATCLDTCGLINKMLQEQTQRPAPCA